MKPAFLLSPLLFLSLAACGPAFAGDDPEPDAAEAHEPEAIGLTRFGARTLLYLEFEPLVRGRSARFLAHFSVLADGEPVRAGRVTLTFGATRLEAQELRHAGLFVPEGVPAETGRFAGVLELAGDGFVERFELGELVVHADEAAAHAAEVAHEEPPRAVPFLLEQQWRVKLLLAEAGPRRLTRRLQVPAVLHTPEDARAAVTAPLGGRLVAPAGGTWPATGATVEAGAVLGELEVALAPGEVAAFEALAAEQELRAVELAREAREAEVERAAAERELERARRVLESGLGTRQELERAEAALTLATERVRARDEALAGLARLRAERARRGPGLRVPLVAPLGGEVASVAAVVGESVPAGAELLRLIAPGRFRVEGRLPEGALGRVRLDAPAVLTLEAWPERRWSLDGRGAGRLAPELDATTRTAGVRYELVDPALRAGLRGELGLLLEEVEAAVAVPREALVPENGIASVYVMLAGELFQRREVELGVEGDGWVEVRDGLASGERVATRGAWLVKLAAAAPASFGHGHAH